MILYTSKSKKVRCIKTKTPKMTGRNQYLWDSFERKLDDIKTYFFFTVKNDRSYFYFLYQEQWYKTEMVQEDGFDLWNYFENWRGNLFTYKIR